MDKKALRKIPVQEADDLVFREAHAAWKDCRYVVSTTLKNGMIIINFYDVTAVRCDATRPVMRTFHTSDDYITQYLASEKTHWMTGSFSNMDCTIRPYEWRYGKGYWISSAFRSLDDMERLMEFFKEYDAEEKKEPQIEVWCMIERCQAAIMDKRLKERHDRELASTDALMATVQEAPREFFDWVWNTGMEFSQYLIYKETKKGIAECECLVCRRKGEVKRSEIRMRNNEKGTCPFCGSKVTFKAKGHMPRAIDDTRYFDYVDPTADGFIFRIFYAWRTAFRPDGDLPAKVVQGIMEVRRAFYIFRPNEHLGFMLDYDPYEWGVYKQRGNERWCPGREWRPCWSNVLYPGNLPEAWAHTPMEYSALEIFSLNRPDIVMRNENMIKFYCRYPKLEWLIKMGLYELVRDAPYFTDGLDLNRKTIYDILGLNKVNTRVLQAVDGGMDILRLLRSMQGIGLYVTPDRLMEYYRVFGGDTTALRPENRRASIHRICRYIRDEAKSYELRANCRYRSAPISNEERKVRNMARDWLDYIEWCRALNYDISNRSVYLPKNFRAVHDRTLEDFTAMNNLIKAEERRRLNEAVRKVLKDKSVAIKKMLDSENKTGRFQIGDLMLVVPKDGEEIRKEGEALHDCLQTYITKVAEGKTNIFFIRKTEEPDVPYFAMEYRDGKVIQVRGKNNCSAPKKVQVFAEAFAEIIREKEKAS